MRHRNEIIKELQSTILEYYEPAKVMSLVLISEIEILLDIRDQIEGIDRRMGAAAVVGAKKITKTVKKKK